MQRWTDPKVDLLKQRNKLPSFELNRLPDYGGLKKGNISKALEEAIEMWIDHVANVYRKTSGKTEIKWS